MLLVFHIDLYTMCAATEGSFGFRIYTYGDKSLGEWIWSHQFSLTPLSSWLSLLVWDPMWSQASQIISEASVAKSSITMENSVGYPLRVLNQLGSSFP